MMGVYNNYHSCNYGLARVRNPIKYCLLLSINPPLMPKRFFPIELLQKILYSFRVLTSIYKTLARL